MHKLNRGGVYPHAETVMNLALRLLDAGFSAEEANHEGVCVQELPSQEWQNGDTPQLRYETYKDFNIRSCESLPMSCCFGNESEVHYGTLSHSHLLLVLLCLQNGVRWPMPEKWAKIVGFGGRVDKAAVAAADSQLAELFEHGLDMEVLSWKIYKEEPSACSLISQALNSGQSFALHTTELTALAVLSSAVTLQLESAVAEEVCFETVKEKVRNELDMYVDQAEFIDLFEFVVNMGAGKTTYISELLDFGAKFVDQKKRQLRLAAFGEANKLELCFPRCKLAMLMRAYRKPPNNTWCPTPDAAFAKAPAADLNKLESLLHYLLVECEPAVAVFTRCSAAS